MTLEELHAGAKAYRDNNQETCSFCKDETPEDQAKCRICKGTGKREPFYPVVATQISVDMKEVFRPKMLFGGACGDFVSIRTILKDDDPNDGKTFLGVIIGELATCGVLHRDNKEPGLVRVEPGLHYPMIFVPDLARVVFGYESWWGRINSPDDLRQITDATINNVWYVQALKALSKKDADAKNAETPDAEV